MILNEEQIANFCVAHLSPSSIRKYLENPHAFFKNYVRLEFDESMGAALVEGDAFHAILAEYYDSLTAAPDKRKAFDWNEAVERIIEEKFNAETLAKIDFGKTGSADKSMGIVRNLIEFYQAELPAVDHVVSVEERFLTDFEDLENVPMPIALKGFTDLIVAGDGDSLIIRDHKSVSTFTDDTEPYQIAKYEMQAAPYFFLSRKRYGRNPECMIFDEVKKSKNRDGSPQRREIVIQYTPEMLQRWLEVYKRVVKSLAGIPLIDPVTGVIQFMPNPYAQYGEDAWKDFCEEIRDGKQWTFDEIKEIRASRFARPEEVEALF